MKINIALVGLAGQYEVGFDKTSALLQKVGLQFKEAGFNVIEAGNIMYDSGSVSKTVGSLKGKDFDLLCICLGTWSEDHHLLDLLDYYDVPVILWAFPAVDTGSLCGVQQICCVLKELGKTYFYVYGEPDNSDVIGEITKISKAVALTNRLKHVKVGSIGGRIKGMTEIAFDEFEVKDKTGVRIVNLDEDELIQSYNATSVEEALAYWENLKKNVGKVTSTDEHGVEAIRYYFAMKKLVAENDLQGLCIKCYPRFMGKICLGYSLLSEEGIVCGCEGDVNNTVSMKILYELTGHPVHNTDILYPDPKLNTILFSHCGAGGFSIADKKEDILLGPVRLAETGVAALFTAKQGKVTVINLVGRKGSFRMSVIVGDAVECGMEFPGNPLKVRFDMNVDEISRIIAREGIGHHWMGGYGDVSEELELFCRLKGIKFIKI
jgi:L-fucose isomerase-like protein